jgi:hypothetical protein
LRDLAEKFYPTRHTTIGAVIDAGLRTHAYCFDCGFDQDVDLNRVANELGRDQSVLPVHLVPKQCHSKNIGTVLVAQGSDVTGEQLGHLKTRRAPGR